MIVIGVVILAAALAVLGFVIYGTLDASQVRIEGFGLAVETSPLVLFLAGAALLLLAEIGLWAIRWGVSRYSRTRSEMERLRRVEAEVHARQADQVQRDADARIAAPPPIEPPFVRREPVAPVSDTPFGRDPDAEAAARPSGSPTTGPVGGTGGPVGSPGAAAAGHPGASPVRGPGPRSGAPTDPLPVRPVPVDAPPVTTAPPLRKDPEDPAATRADSRPGDPGRTDNSRL